MKQQQQKNQTVLRMFLKKKKKPKWAYKNQISRNQKSNRQVMLLWTLLSTLMLLKNNVFLQNKVLLSCSLRLSVLQLFYLH